MVHGLEVIVAMNRKKALSSKKQVASVKPVVPAKIGLHPRALRDFVNGPWEKQGEGSSGFKDKKGLQESKQS